LIKRAEDYYIQMMCNILEEGKKSGEINEGTNSEVLAWLFWRMIDGIGFQYSVLQENYPYKEAVENAKSMFIHSLK
jgi:hypothetical protein